MAGGLNPAQTQAVRNMAANAPQMPNYMQTQAMPGAYQQLAQAAPTQQANPATVPQGSGPSVYDQSAGAYRAALGLTSQAAGPANVAPFMNPYTRMVTGQTMQDLERQRQMQMNQIGSSASQAGAFGGSRHGVAEALTNEAFARQGAQAFGNLQQQGFNTALQAAQNQQANQLAAGGQMGQLAGQGFGFGQQIAQQQAQQGAQQQALQNALIAAAQQQFGNVANYPQQALSLPLQALGMTPYGQTTTGTQTANPGLFGTLGSMAQLGGLLFGSDRRLKKNVKRLGDVVGFNIYAWDWNDEGKRIVSPIQPPFGVMADELQETHPHLVHKGSDGYLRVDYAGLNAELNGAA